MELLTNRLSMLVQQVADHQMDEIINEERSQHERMMKQTQRDTMLSFKAMAQEEQMRRSVSRNTLNWKKRQDEHKKNEEIKKQEAINEPSKIKTVCDIWGLSKKAKGKVMRAEEPKDSSKDSSNSAMNLVKFRQVAKTAVLLKTMTRGHDICTCESLDARCKVHDS